MKKALFKRSFNRNMPGIVSRAARKEGTANYNPKGTDHYAMLCLIGVATGLLNGFFGAGGGMAAVPMLKASGLEEKNAHASSLMIMLPLSIMSGGLYLADANFSLKDALILLPGGLSGALFGAWLLPRLSVKWLRLIFGALIIYCAGRMLFS